MSWNQGGGGGLHMVGANIPKVKLLKTLLSKQNKATAQRERHTTNRSFGSPQPFSQLTVMCRIMMPSPVSVTWFSKSSYALRRAGKHRRIQSICFGPHHTSQSRPLIAFNQDNIFLTARDRDDR